MDLTNLKDEDSQSDKNVEMNSKSPNKKEIDIKKKQMTLNLDSSKSRKKQVISNGNNSSNNNPNSFTSILDPNSIWSSQMGKVILESPDMQMFGLHTPDVEKFLSESKLGSTPTPSLANRNFVQSQIFKHLGDLKNNNSQNNNSNNTNSNSDSSRPPSNASSNSNYYLNSDQFNPTQDDNSSMISGGNNSNCSFNTSNNSANNQSFNENADLNPINMMRNQDLTKLERKRLRNRIAASKCRKRKLEKISDLERRVSKLKDENNLLAQEVVTLRNKNEILRSEVITHKKNGCNIDLSMIN